MRKVLIVGATSAIAIACARLWSEKGATMFLVARNAEKLDAVARDLEVRGSAAAHRYLMDVTDIAAHSSMLDAAALAMGSIDTILIAHGTLPDQAACEADASLALHEFSTNGTSVIALLITMASYLERQGSGAIGVITSVAGDRGRPSNYIYGSAKAAVSVFCEGLRARLFRNGVSLTDIRPGFVATPMTAGLRLPSLLVSRPDVVAKRIIPGIDRRDDVLYVPAFWALIMFVIRSIPRAIFKRLKL